MDRLIFYLILVLTAGLISLITGRNKRQIRRIPEGMGIMCQPPGKRELLWRNIRSVELVRGEVRGVKMWKKCGFIPMGQHTGSI